jgi:protocatechuate 3,4-dioxygenase beta subunit
MNFRLAAVLYLFLQTPVASTPPPELPKGSIEGIVIRSVTGDPLERAQVTLNRITPPATPPPPGQPTPTASTPLAQIPAQYTEVDGKFLFKDLNPGQYRLMVRANGYANQEYGQRVVVGPGTPINLTQGQAMKEITFKMIQNGTVTGHVRDARGDPVAGISISLMRSVYNVNGQRTLNSAGSAVTDDRGEYRAFWIPPGRYYVSATAGSSAISVLVLGGNVFADRVFPQTFYPGVLDPSRASVIEIQPGAEINGVDIVMTQPGTFRIRGKVLDTAGQPPKGFTIGLVPRVEAGAPLPLTSGASNYSATTNPENGNFELRNIIPGSYWLRATMSTNADDPVPANLVNTARTAVELLDLVLGANRGTAQIPVDVVNADVENANLTMMPTISIPVQLSLDNMQLNQLGGMDRIRINLRNTNPSAPSSSQRSAFSDDGRGSIENVSPGEYRILANFGAQPDLYLKDVRFGTKSALNDPIQIANQNSETLSIVLSNNAGRVDGTLLDDKSKPQPGVPVILIPDESRDRYELYKNTSTDQTGHYAFRGIPPGNYKLFAWEAIETNSYYDRDVLAQYDSQGKPVRIQESSKDTVDLKLIPARK